MKLLDNIFFLFRKKDNITFKDSTILLSFILMCIFTLFSVLIIYENQLQLQNTSAQTELDIDDIKEMIINNKQSEFTNINFSKSERDLISNLRTHSIKYYFNPEYEIATEGSEYDPQYFYIALLENLFDIAIEIIEPIEGVTAIEAIEKGIADFTTIGKYEDYNNLTLFKSTTYSSEKIYGAGTKYAVNTPRSVETVFLQDYDESINFNMLSYSIDNAVYYNNLTTKEKIELHNKINNNEDYLVIGNYVHIKNILKDSGAYLKEYASSSDIHYISSNKQFISLINKLGDKFNSEELFNLNYAFKQKQANSLFLELLSEDEQKIMENVNNFFYHDDTISELTSGYMSFYFKYVDTLVQVATSKSNYEIQMYNIPNNVKYLSNFLIDINIKGLDTKINYYETDAFITDKPNLISLSNFESDNIIYSLDELSFFNIGVLKSQEELLLKLINTNYSIDEFKSVKIYNDVPSLINALVVKDVDFLITYPKMYSYIDHRLLLDFNLNLHENNYLLKEEDWVFKTTNYTLSTILDKYILLIENDIDYHDKYIETYLYSTTEFKDNNSIYRITILTIALFMSFTLFYLLRKYDIEKLVAQSKIYNYEKGFYTNKAFKEHIKNTAKDYTVVSITINDYEKLEDICSTKEFAELNKILIFRLKLFASETRSKLFKICDNEYYIVTKDTSIQSLDLDKNILSIIKNTFLIFERELFINFKINKINGNFIQKDNIAVDKFVNYMNLQKNDILRKGSILNFKNSMYPKLYDAVKIEDAIINFNVKNLHPLYQPIINISTGKIVGVETFSNIKVHNKLYPAIEFIALAEKYDKLKIIDEFLLNNTIIKRKHLMKNNIVSNYFQFSINASKEFIKNITSDLLQKLCKFHNLDDLSFMTFEINEAIVKDSSLKENLKIIRSFNIKISLDSIENSLYIFTAIDNEEIDIIKFNKSVTKLKNDNLINILKELLHLKEIEYIGKYVETSKEYHYLKKIGFQKLQGYYFSVPVDYENLINYLKL